jgi:hypothetical protein
MNSRKAWDIDAEEMNNTPSIAETEEGGEAKELVQGNIKRPIHKNQPLKMVVLFAGGAGLIGAICFAFFGSAFNSKPQVANKAPTPAASTLSTTEQEQLANAEAAIAMGGSNKAFESHGQREKKEESTPANSPSADKKAAPKPAPEPAKTPEVIASKPPTPAKATTPTVTPVVYRQPQPVVQTRPSAAPQPQYQASRIAANSGQAAEIKALKNQIDKLTKAIESKKQEPKQVAIAPKPTVIASAAPAKVATLSSPTPSTTEAKPEEATLPAIDGNASARLLDAITIAAGNSGGANQAQSLVRIQLTQPIPTNKGMQIPQGSIVAMNVEVANNGLVRGSSVGVWDTRTGQQLDVPAGALVIEGVKGEPLIAQSIKPSDAIAQGADTEAAIWKAVGGGVDGLTRLDSNTSVSAGTIITTATSGGSRDFLTNAAGGFAKQKASSLEKQSSSDRDKINAQAALWHLPMNTAIVVSARPLIPVQSAKYAQMSTGQNSPATRFNANQNLTDKVRRYGL